MKKKFYVKKPLRVLFYIILSIFFLSCKKSKQKIFSGYYFDEKTLDIYHFKGNSLKYYNLYDSIHYTTPIKVSKKSISIKGKKYYYKFFGKDTLKIRDLTVYGGSLIKFNYKDLNISDLYNSEFKLEHDTKSNTDIDYFVRFHKQKMMSFAPATARLYRVVFISTVYS